MNLIKVYNLLAEYDLSELYNAKLPAVPGFPVILDDEDEDEGYEEDELNKAS